MFFVTRYVSKQKEVKKKKWAPITGFLRINSSSNLFSLFIIIIYYVQFSTDFDSENRRSVCHASRDFGNSEQVFIFYGRRTCAEQLIHNGFVDVNNSFDALALRIGLSKSDPLAQQRTDLLRKLRILTGI